ncbi:class I SAM-dependent methyltransferase [Planotetraspora kaengkrachanensis]|uniref:Methyltransferase n=1 Tax=Planotetraspora kaengkrachanensis TaxID=575193 RepID=A0A8J3PTQ2_9ACTN|nr:class I SAM-dependent methyltransferase [Planotetraspora kaengkrachanensis]GIG80726.1 methyltransferase [Planotetraspora kaengkrachanensis]
MTIESGSGSARQEYRALQAEAFNRIGVRYDDAFPHKEGQVAAGEWLIKQLKPGSRVLDVGCGTGAPSAQQFAQAGCEVTGIDISPVMLEIARENVPEGTFLELDVLELDGSLGAFDAVTAFFSLLMLPRAGITEALGKIYSALAPGGLFSLSMVEIDLDDVPFQFLGAPVRVTGYLRDELRAAVEDAGFTVLTENHISYAPATTQAPPEIQLFFNCRREQL